MQVPQIIPVTRGGARIGWESLLKALENAYFVAVDTEFSGLGDVKLLYGNCLSEKYSGLKQIVSNRAIFSVGFSIFSAADTCSAEESLKALKGQTTEFEENQKPPCKFYVTTFDFLFLPSDDFMISPSSATFLVRHGFDFARLFLDGIYYTRPTFNRDYQLLKTYKTCTLERKQSSDSRKKTKKRKKKDNSELFLELSTTEETKPDKSSLLSILPLGLLVHLGQTDIPIVFHNGLLDLAFLYSCFEDNLPESCEEFVKNLRQLLPHIYDTKCLSCDQDSEKETSLDTVYQLCVSWNQKQKSNDETFIQCWTPDNIPSRLETAPTPLFKGNPNFHEVENSYEKTIENSEIPSGWNGVNNVFAHSDHSAGYDAFCTGYIFATYLHSKGLSYLTKQRNSIYLSRFKSLSL
ncbi:hypothetical protein GAYE_SCF04G2474 [Galdieria yellowstonensis]|uniref:Uncharacterized protein n=1 Tax=Galdieria yellowstonensis TaxID=3028027 RepID=A0AAV9IB44_9RHOD|nr:hypothetical protein GAYE_SCF04G2474 [Galdieria yellowstonensis]